MPWRFQNGGEGPSVLKEAKVSGLARIDVFFGEVVESMCAIGWKPVCGIGIMQGVLSEGFEALLVEGVTVCV